MLGALLADGVGACRRLRARGQAWLPEQLRPDEVSLNVHTHDAIALYAV
jgi:hypothetical protein